MHPDLSAELWPAASRRRDIGAFLQDFGQDWPALLDSPAWQIATQLSAELERRGAAAAALDSEPAFHNREHICDVLLALRLLLRHAPELSLSDTSALLIAMIAHDFDHPGRPNTSRRELEARAWHDIATVLTPLPDQQRSSIRHLILSTDPAEYPRLQRPMASSRARNARAQIAIAADLMASILPLRGFYLGHRLAQELSTAGHPAAQNMATLEGRAAFLSRCPPLGNAAEKLGLQQLINAQLQLIAKLSAHDLRRPWSPEWGAAFATQVEKLGSSQMSCN